MLSYKLKHLCSRMIASLSAVGLFSVNTGAAQAATYTYQVGDALKYNVLGNTTFSAKMTEMSPVDYCLTGGAENVARVYIEGGNCVYECASGYAFFDATKESDGAPVTSLTGELRMISGKYQPYTLTDTCAWGVYGTCHTSGETSSHIESAEYVPGEDPQCRYICEQGYHASISTPTGLCADGVTKGCGAGESGWVETGKAGDVYPEYLCLPNKYIVTFDCGTGLISGTTSSTLKKDATYVSGLIIPNEAICIRDGYKMEGWNSDKEFEIEK